MRNKSYTRRWVCIAISLPALTGLFLGGYFLLTTQKGLKIVVQSAAPFLSGHLEISGLNGCLLGPIQVKGVRYTSPNTRLELSEAKLDWTWKQLWQGQFKLNSLFIDQLTISIKKKSLSTKIAPNLNALPKSPGILKHLQWGAVTIHQLTVHYGDLAILQAKGSFGKQWACHWKLNILGPIKTIPGWHGTPGLEGEIKGERRSPEFYISLPPTYLQWKDWQFQQVRGTFHLAMASHPSWQLKLNTTRFRSKTLSITPLQLKISGYLQPFTLQGNLSPFQLQKITAEKINTKLFLANKIDINSKLSTRGLKTTLTASQDSKSKFRAQLLLPGYRTIARITPQQAFVAQVYLSLKDLHFLSPIMPYLKNPLGSLESQLRLSGSFSSPLIDLQLKLKDASTQIPSLGLYLKKLNLQFHTDQGLLIGSGSCNSGKGTLSFHTKTQLTQHQLPTLINLQGNNIEISHTSRYKITASPKLQIQASTKQVSTKGLIIFPKANLRINAHSANETKLSQDIIFETSQQKHTASLPIHFENNIKLQLGNAVYLHYQGLNTQLGGSLAITQLTEHPLLATGKLTLFPGIYTYYSKTLNLQSHSALHFAYSPINDPKLDITASKKVWVLPRINTDTTVSRLGSSSSRFLSSALQTSQATQVTVGIHLRGSKENPSITLFSDPANLIPSQIDILSYLITDQASSQLSSASVELLIQTAAHLGGQQTGLGRFINQTQKKIGLDQLTIGAKPIFDPTTNSLQQNTSLIIGKHFSPRLSVSYSLGLIHPINILQINYLLNKNFSLQSTNSSFANGIDLMYKLERK